MTMDELIASTRRRLREAESAARADDEGLVLMRGRIERGDDAISLEQVKTAIRKRDAARADVETFREKLNFLIEEKRKDDEVDRLSQIVIPTSAARQETGMTATFSLTEESLYRPDHARTGGPSFLTDLFRSQLLGDPQAGERLARHGAEVQSRGQLTQRDVTTGGVSSFVPPQYLVEQFAELARAGRPVADLVTHLPLPETGMTVNIPKVTTGTTVASQSVENSPIAESDPAAGTLAVPVVTVAGFTDISRQALERGELVEEMVLADLASAYNTELDRQVINGAGAGGQHTGILLTPDINTVTYTDADPTLQELYPILAKAIGKVVGQRFAGPTAIVMTPARWAWMNAVLSSEFPLIQQANGGNTNTGGSAEAPGYGGVVGRLMGVPVVLDGSIPTNLGAGTNEDRIVVADLRDSLLLEDPNGAPQQLKFESIGSATLTVRLLGYGYSAFTAARQPKAISVVQGTGLVAPAA